MKKSFRNFTIFTLLTGLVLGPTLTYAQNPREKLIGYWNVERILNDNLDRSNTEGEKVCLQISKDKIYVTYWNSKKNQRFDTTLHYSADEKKLLIKNGQCVDYWFKRGDSLVFEYDGGGIVFSRRSGPYEPSDYVARGRSDEEIIERPKNRNEQLSNQTYGEREEQTQQGEQVQAQKVPYYMKEWARSPKGDLEFYVEKSYIDWRYHYSNQAEDIPYLALRIGVKNLQENVYYDFADSRLLDDQGKLWVPEINRYGRTTDEFAKANNGQSSELILNPAYSKQWRTLLFPGYPISGRYVFFLPTGDEDFKIRIGNVQSGLAPKKR